MMKNTLARLMLLAVMGVTLVASRSKTNEVPSLDTEQWVKPTAVVEEEPLDDEAKMMAFDRPKDRIGERSADAHARLLSHRPAGRRQAGSRDTRIVAGLQR